MRRLFCGRVCRTTTPPRALALMQAWRRIQQNPRDVLPLADVDVSSGGLSDQQQRVNTPPPPPQQVLVAPPQSLLCPSPLPRALAPWAEVVPIPVLCKSVRFQRLSNDAQRHMLQMIAAAHLYRAVDAIAATVATPTTTFVSESTRGGEGVQPTIGTETRDRQLPQQYPNDKGNFYSRHWTTQVGPTYVAACPQGVPLASWIAQAVAKTLQYSPTSAVARAKTDELHLLEEEESFDDKKTDTPACTNNAGWTPAHVLWACALAAKVIATATAATTTTSNQRRTTRPPLGAAAAANHQHSVAASSSALISSADVAWFLYQHLQQQEEQCILSNKAEEEEEPAEEEHETEDAPNEAAAAAATGRPPSELLAMLKAAVRKDFFSSKRTTRTTSSSWCGADNPSWHRQPPPPPMSHLHSAVSVGRCLAMLFANDGVSPLPVPTTEDWYRHLCTFASGPGKVTIDALASLPDVAGVLRRAFPQPGASTEKQSNTRCITSDENSHFTCSGGEVEVEVVREWLLSGPLAGRRGGQLLVRHRLLDVFMAQLQKGHRSVHCPSFVAFVEACGETYAWSEGGSNGDHNHNPVGSSSGANSPSQSTPGKSNDEASGGEDGAYSHASIMIPRQQLMRAGEKKEMVSQHAPWAIDRALAALAPASAFWTALLSRQRREQCHPQQEEDLPLLRIALPRTHDCIRLRCRAPLPCSEPQPQHAEAHHDSPPISTHVHRNSPLIPQTLFEDEALLVISKPSGLPTMQHALCHHTAGTTSGTPPLPSPCDDDQGRCNGDVVTWLWWHRPAQRKLFQCGVVHRLDAGTSGVMVIAKSDDASVALRSQLGGFAVNSANTNPVDSSSWMQSSEQNEKSEKVYWALCRTLSATTARRPLVIGREVFVQEGLDRNTPHHPSQTRYTVLEHLPMTRLALVQATIATGKKHQIRRHLAAEGLPLLGDTTYGGPLVSTSLCPRVALHAHSLALKHPLSGDLVAFNAPMADDLAIILDQFRRMETAAAAARDV